MKRKLTALATLGLIATTLTMFVATAAGATGTVTGDGGLIVPITWETGTGFEGYSGGGNCTQNIEFEQVLPQMTRHR